MKIRQLEAFRALILRQTVTRAADMLHISQPAVTRLINDLEADVGFSLFDRINGRLNPTPEALVLFEEVERSFAGIDRIAQTAEQIKSLRRGSLHIAGAPALALEFLPTTLTGFMREHPGISTTLLIHASSIVVDFITPETETSIHYFWGMARNFKPQDPSLTVQIRDGQGKIFAEDQEMLEMQQQNLLRYPERKLLMLNIDAGGVQSRKVLDRILAAEGQAA